MSVYLTNAPAGSIPIGHTELWQHYLRTHFLYPAKLEQLAYCQRQIGHLWPRLLKASPHVFQLHGAAHGGELASSLSGFRDTARRFVIQHAASSRHPDLLIECLLAMTVGIALTSADYAVMYYRESNAWPRRLQRILATRQAAGACDCLRQQYLRAESAFAGWPAGVERLSGELPAEAIEVLRSAWGALRVKSLGLDAYERGELSGLYRGCGLERDQHVLAAVQGGRIAGVAVIHLGSAPLNLSFLCNRVEVALAGAGEDAAAAVTSLLTAARQLFAEKHTPHFVALLAPEHAAIASAEGYQATGREYSSFLWSKDGEHGTAPTAIAIARWFQTLGAREARRERSQEKHAALSGPPLEQATAA
jgi:hypothetical protein